MKHLKAAALLGAAILGASAPLAVSASAAADLYDPETPLVAPPTVVCDVTSAEIYASLTGEILPSNAIVHVDKDGNAVGKDGKVIATAEAVCERIEGRILPIFFAGNAEEAAAVSDLLKRTGVTDCAVMSDDPALVRSMREGAARVRGIVSFPTLPDLGSVVATVNSSRASVAVLSQKDATREVVDYIQARFKTVWVRVDEATPLAYEQAIVSGAFGVVSEDFFGPYIAMDGFDDYTLARARMPYNVAHRGMGQNGLGANENREYNENSASSCRKAMEMGATHLEVDAYITTDDEIVIMHDDTLDRTTDGTGRVEDHSYAELSAYRLDWAATKEPIPTLDDILDIVSDTGAILVLEVKTSQAERFITALKAKIAARNAQDGCDYWQQIVVITFVFEVMQAFRDTLPEVPVSNLNALPKADNELLDQLCRYNIGVDSPNKESYGAGADEFDSREKFLLARGYVGWHWTYGQFRPEHNVQGITTNDPRAQGILRTISAKSFLLEEGQTVSKGDEVDIVAIDYCGQSADLRGEIAFLEETDGGYVAIASYDSGHGTLFTEAFPIYAPWRAPEKDDAADGEKGGCGSTLSCAPLLLLGAAPLLHRRKH